MWKDRLENPSFLNTNDSKESIYSDLSDLMIWRKFKEGDEEAFVYIYRTYVNDLYQIGIQLTRDKALIKDCIQEFFIDIRDHASNLSDTDNIRLYLIKSFRRKAYKFVKKQRQLVSQDQIDESFFVELATDENIINAQFNKEQLTRLNKALAELKVKDREIIYYYFYENLSYSKIADILEYDHVSSARRSVYKILNRLKQIMVISITLFLSSMPLQS